jgi:caa(3)-type oxidase subunit IV
MSHEHEGLGYSIFKIFVVLFVLTALEVFWGMSMRGFGRFVLWGGLLAFALAKGLLIFMYFMHMKFERFLVWSLIVPTPILICVILGALSPDLSFNGQRDHPVANMLDEHGQVVDMNAAFEEHQAKQAGGGGH